MSSNENWEVGRGRESNRQSNLPFFHLSPCRDIPMPLVSSGVEHGNLRELALARMKELGTEVSTLYAMLR